MGRTNKVTSGVFVELVGNSKQISAYDEFINSKVSNSSEELKKYTEEYKSLITKTKTVVDKLAKLEEIILQMRSRDSLEISDIKLSIVREYIYARVPFYRRDKGAKDIRVINGLTEFYGDDINKLLRDSMFMENAKEKLLMAINSEIEDNKIEYKKIS